MGKLKPLLAAFSILFLATGTSGCAAYRSHTRCGWGGCSGDAQISAEVRERLDQHPVLRPPNQVYVQTLEGVVYLSGQVATDLQREIATAAAREVAGAQRVVNTIALTYAGR